MRHTRILWFLPVFLLPACYLPGPRPMSEWEVRSHPLYPPTVWVETRDGTRGGGVVVANPPEGTYVLTAFHVVRGTSGIEVGAFRHSVVDPAPGSPEYDRHPAELVAGGYVLDEAVRAPFAALVASLRRLLEAGGGVERYPTLKKGLLNFTALTESLEAAREPSNLADALEAFLATRPLDDSELAGRELDQAVQRASAGAGDPDVGPALIASRGGGEAGDDPARRRAEGADRADRG